MAETKKITKRDNLNYLIEKYGDDPRVVAYATHEIELLDNKNSSKKPSVSATENVEIANKLVEILKASDNAMTITEILDLPEVKEIKVYNEDTKEVDKALSNQRVSYILNHDTRFTREVVKKKAYFKA